MGVSSLTDVHELREDGDVKGLVKALLNSNPQIRREAALALGATEGIRITPAEWNPDPRTWPKRWPGSPRIVLPAYRDHDVDVGETFIMKFQMKPAFSVFDGRSKATPTELRFLQAMFGPPSGAPGTAMVYNADQTVTISITSERFIFRVGKLFEQGRQIMDLPHSAVTGARVDGGLFSRRLVLTLPDGQSLTFTTAGKKWLDAYKAFRHQYYPWPERRRAYGEYLSARKSGHLDAVEALIKRLHDKDAGVRAAAATALRLLGGPRASQVLPKQSSAMPIPQAPATPGR